VTADQTVSPLTADHIQLALGQFLEERVKTTVAMQQDLFKSGLVSSMFAMELVVHLEDEYGIAIVGPDLKLDSFRTIEAMTELVLRLSAVKADNDG